MPLQTNEELLVVRLNAASGKTPERPTWSALKKQAEINLLEAQEILQACEDKNLNDLRDAIADNRVTNYGFGAIADLPYQDDFLLVVGSLYSRFHKEADRAIVSQQFFSGYGLRTKIVRSEVEGTVYYAVVVDGAQTLDRGIYKPGSEYYPDGKFLKGVDTVFPDFSKNPTAVVVLDE